MKLLWVPTVAQVIDANKKICVDGGNPHQVLNRDRIESSIHSAFYPGSAPFAAGGIAGIASALAFYLIKGHPFQDGNKRTATVVAVAFMNVHSWDLKYPFDESKDVNDLANIIEKAAASEVSKDQFKDWFEGHKITLSEADQ